MKKAILFALFAAVVMAAVPTLAGNVTKIAYQAQTEGKKGYYTVGYNSNGLLSTLTNSAHVTFGMFQADNFRISYPEPTEVYVQRNNGTDDCASYTYTSLGGQKWNVSFRVLHTGYGDGTFGRDGSNLSTKLYSRKKALTSVGSNKFKNGNLVESNLKIDGKNTKLKMTYTGVPYSVFSYGFDYMSFIISEFLGVQFGCFDLWPCIGACFMSSYPATIEIANLKYVFDYNSSMNHMEVKLLMNNKMEERYIFDITQ